MKPRSPRSLVLLALALSAAVPASAAPIVFNFNSITLNPGVTTDGLAGAANSTAIKNYMNTVLGCSPGCVTSVTGALATANYTADGNGYQSSPGHYVTLGTTDRATSFTSAPASTSSPDVFIMNDNLGVYANSDSFTITFASNWAAGTTVSFDYEIFADDTCAPCSSGSGNFPDLDFYAGGVHQGSTPTETASGYEAFDPQGLGTASFTLTNATNTFEWVDWPSEIGIDNLSFAPPPLRTVPEPSPLPLAGLALALLALIRTRGRRGGGPTATGCVGA